MAQSSILYAIQIFSSPATNHKLIGKLKVNIWKTWKSRLKINYFKIKILVPDALSLMW